MRILIIEDEYNLADAVATRLRRDNYIVDINTDGEEGLDNALTNIYDLILLDVMLPSINGFDILKEIKKEKVDSKVIMVTAKSMLDDKLTGFDFGAIDYITKPFHIEEVAARVNAQLRNNDNVTQKDYIEIGDLKLNNNKSTIECTKTGEEIEIICKEFQLLEYFMQNNNRILSRDQIYDKVWGMDNESESNNLEAYISFIRRKLKAIGSTASIKAIRGMGYKFEV